LHAAVVRRTVLLPHAPRAPPRPQATEPACESAGRYQVGRLRTRKGNLRPGAQLHARGRHALVPRSGGAARRSVLLHCRGHVESCVYLRRDGYRSPPLPRRLGDRPALQDLPGARHAHATGTPGSGCARIMTVCPFRPGPAWRRCTTTRAPSRSGRAFVWTRKFLSLDETESRFY
ncbi:hypothetical protein AAVH_39535, partial [Aphelenchoides avenae]